MSAQQHWYQTEQLLTIANKQIDIVTNVIEKSRDLDTAHVHPSITLLSSLYGKWNIPSLQSTGQAESKWLSVGHLQAIGGDNSVLTAEQWLMSPPANVQQAISDNVIFAWKSNCIPNLSNHQFWWFAAGYST